MPVIECMSLVSAKCNSCLTSILVKKNSGCHGPVVQTAHKLSGALVHFGWKLSTSCILVKKIVSVMGLWCRQLIKLHYVSNLYNL